MNDLILRIVRLSLAIGLVLACRGSLGANEQSERIHLPRNSYIPLTTKVEEEQGLQGMPVNFLILEGPFFQLRAKAAELWRVETTADPGLRFTHPYISGATVTYTLFPVDLFLPHDSSLDWKAMYLNGLALEHLTAEALQPDDTFVKKSSEDQREARNRVASQKPLTPRERQRQLMEEQLQQYREKYNLHDDLGLDFAEDGKPNPNLKTDQQDQEQDNHTQFSVQSVDYRLETVQSPMPLYCRDYFVQLYDGKDVYCMRVHFERTEFQAKTILEDMFTLFHSLQKVEPADKAVSADPVDTHR